MQGDDVGFLEAVPLLPSHTAITVELVFNALDAGATHLQVVVDLLRNQIRCRDDGTGIPLAVWPYILKAGHSFDVSGFVFKRNSHTLAKLRQIAELTIVTKLKNESSPRRMSVGVVQYASPIFVNGTEVIVTAAFERAKNKIRELGPMSAKRKEMQRIKSILSTILLKFPQVLVTVDFGTDKFEMKTCGTVEERWKQITGNSLLLDSDGIMTRYRNSNQSTFQSTLCPFLVRSFPCSVLVLDNREVKVIPNTVSAYEGIVIDKFHWGVEGIEIHAVTKRSSMLETRKTDSVGPKELAMMKVVGIWDAKFIICHHSNLVYAIDQHAAHERVNLQRLLDRIDQVISSRDLKIEVTVKVPIANLTILPLVKPELRRWGWKVIQAGRSWKIHAIPVVCDVPVEDIQGLLDFVDKIQSNCKPEIPECILHILQTKACRGSIKFGDVITNDVASDLIKMLSQTTRPNHCAHGRTVAVPIYDLTKPFHKFLSVQQCPK